MLLSLLQGGTESIICAIKSHRDFYRDNFGITEPEMVVGNSAHAAVDKACDMLRIKLIKVALGPKTFKIDLAAMERAIGPNTIMMYASAPSFPHGVIDPVLVYCSFIAFHARSVVYNHHILYLNGKW
jgi:sphinganine-1-phosphate aldolase